VDSLLAWSPPSPVTLVPPPQGWNAPVSEENPLTEEGIALGETLFHDPILSKDSSVSCATCHRREDAFSDRGQRVSVGVFGKLGKRNTPALMNLAWSGLYFWDGRVETLEEQALHPVRDTNEMALPWSVGPARIQKLPKYRRAFRKAFGDAPIDSVWVARALAQYVRSLVSSGSRFDRWKLGEVAFTEAEMLGYELFNSNATQCHHCHREPFFTSHSFHDIGLDSITDGTGLGAAFGIPENFGKWKVPSLRNWAFTAPYMHDGRFATFEEVIEFYASGGHDSPNLDATMRNEETPNSRLLGGLSPDQRQALVAFLRTLNDSSFVQRK
jgi:cytochrome c peroxidase